jgi:hypothetical protein
MALTTEIRNYEILIRFHKDGTIGAHKQNIQTVDDAGTLISETPLPPQSLNISELKSIVSDF